MKTASKRQASPTIVCATSTQPFPQRDEFEGMWAEDRAYGEMFRRPLRWLDSNWRRYIIGPRVFLDSFWKFDSRDLPVFSGIYFLWSEDWRLLYIGKASCIYNRMVAHGKAGRIPAVYVTCFELESPVSPQIETAYIHALTPPYNVRYEPKHWKHHERAEKLIRRLWRRTEAARNSLTP